MSKYEKGDRVVIVDTEPLHHPAFVSVAMSKWLGQTMTVQHIDEAGWLRMEEVGWNWHPDWIAGYAEPESTVEIAAEDLFAILEV